MFVIELLKIVMDEIKLKLKLKYSLFTLNSLLDMPQITNSIALEC